MIKNNTNDLIDYFNNNNNINIINNYSLLGTNKLYSKQFQNNDMI